MVSEKKTVQVKKSGERKKKIKKKKREERLAGLILLIITVFVGFVLWVSGELKTTKSGWEGADNSTVIIK